MNDNDHTTFYFRGEVCENRAGEPQTWTRMYSLNPPGTPLEGHYMARGECIRHAYRAGKAPLFVEAHDQG